MKKILLKISGSILSKEDMKTIKGGYDGGGGNPGGNGCGPHCIYCWIGPTQMPPLCGSNVCCPTYEEGMAICQHAYSNSIFSNCW